MSETSFLNLKCSCRTVLRVPASAAGAAVKCPKCGGSLKVPSKGDPPAAINAEPSRSLELAPPPGIDLSGDLQLRLDRNTSFPRPDVPVGPADRIESPIGDDLAPTGRTFEINFGDADEPREKCKRCGESLRKGAVLCVHCGLNQRTGKRIHSAKEQKDSPRGLARQPTKRSEGSLIWGACGSLVAVVVLSAAWWMLAKGAGSNHGWAAIVVGLGSGIAMFAGRRARTLAGAGIAVGFFLLAVLTVKGMMFSKVRASYDPSSSMSAAQRREHLAREFAKQSLNAEDIDSQAEWDAQWDAAMNAARTRVELMSDQTVRASCEEIQSKQRIRFEMDQPRNEERTRLAQYRASLRADDEGLMPTDPARRAYAIEEYAKLESMPVSEYQEALAEFGDFAVENRYEDPAYVRNRLVYLRINDELQKKPRERQQDISKAEWMQLFRRCRAEVDGMSARDRKAALMSLNTKQAEAQKRGRLIEHDFGREIRHLGIPFGDPLAKRQREKVTTEIERLSQPQLQERIDQLDAWQAGPMWDDTEYLRDLIIYDHIERDLEAQRGRHPRGWEPGAEQWIDLYNAALDAVELIPDAQLATTVRGIQKDEASAEPAKPRATPAERFARDGVITVHRAAAPTFTASMFGPLDLLFAGIGAVLAGLLGLGPKS